MLAATPGGYDPAKEKPDTRDKTLVYREQFRQSEVPAWYSGTLHFWFTTLFSLLGIGVAISLVEHVTPWEWLIIPVTFLYANFAEYVGHRGPMHHKSRYLPLIYLHTSIHHRYFTHDAFGCDDHRDFSALLLHPIFLLFFFGVFAVPVGALLFYLLSANVAYLFVATALAYFLCYEWLHFCYHVQEDSWVLGAPFMRRLRQLHHEHHNPSLMSHYNFNITFPIFDWIFGSLYHHDEQERADPVSASGPKNNTA